MQVLVVDELDIRESVLDDAEIFAPILRPIDVIEVASMSGRSPRSVLRSGVRFGEVARSVFIGGEPVCMFGVVRNGAFSDEGTIWMLGTEAIRKNSFKFLRNCADQVKDMVSGFSKVANLCHADNKTTLRWLKWLGFTIEAAKPQGKKGEMFHYFFMENK